MYNTDNIAVASALRSFGHQISKIEVEGKKATFYFEEETREVAQDIQLGNALVDAIKFHLELRRLSGLARSMSMEK